MANRHSNSASAAACSPKPWALLLLFLLVSSSSPPAVAEARLLPSSSSSQSPASSGNQPRYLKVLATLGIACQCCDSPAAASACRPIAGDNYSACSVNHLNCGPWKFA